MKITHQLIQQYLNGHCSPKEEQFVKDWLLLHPEWLGKLMTERSWDEFTGETSSVEASFRMFEYIAKKTSPRTTKWRWVAAACVTLLLLTGSIYLSLQYQKTPQLAIAQPVHSDIFTSNNSPEIKRIILPDGSIVKLSQGSTLRYDSGFLGGREIFLTGEASFSVAKDKTRPFCVHSKNINVTALGTMFSISDRDALLTSVKLFEGKVVIKKERDAVKNLKDIFLNPGQELSFNNKDFSYRLTNIEEKSANHHEPQVAKIQVRSVPAKMNFNDQSLSDIFSELQKQYNIKIIFKTGSLDDIRFTGTHNPSSETLEDFLNLVAMLNDLKVEKISNVFMISPNQ